MAFSSFILVTHKLFVAVAPIAATLVPKIANTAFRVEQKRILDVYKMSRNYSNESGLKAQNAKRMAFTYNHKDI